MRSDFQMLFIMLTGLLYHINRVYPVGAKGDELLDCYQANVMSMAFVVAISLLLSMKELWPSALRHPSRPVMYLYLALVSAFTVSVSLRMIWLPLTMSLTKSNLWVATKIKSTRGLKRSFLFKTVHLLESRFFHKAEMALLAFSFLAYALKASGIYGQLTKDEKQMYDLQIPRHRISKPRIAMAPKNSENQLPYIIKRPEFFLKRKDRQL